jgi:hypothetical protein
MILFAENANGSRRRSYKNSRIRNRSNRGPIQARHGQRLSYERELDWEEKARPAGEEMVVTCRYRRVAFTGDDPRFLPWSHADSVKCGVRQLPSQLMQCFRDSSSVEKASRLGVMEFQDRLVWGASPNERRLARAAGLSTFPRVPPLKPQSSFRLDYTLLLRF